MKEYTILLHDGFRVGVTEGGAGIPLVFLHGLGVSARAYTEMLELLADSGFRVIAIDLPDHGRSDELPWGHTVADMALVVSETLVRICANDSTLEGARPVVVGHSMGGAVALELAAYPRNWPVSTLVMLDAAAGEEHHHSIRVDRSPFLPLRAAQYFAGAFRDLAGDVCRAKQLRSRSDNMRLLKTLRRSVSGLGCLKAARALMLADTEKALRAVRGRRTNTLVVHGSKDGIVPRDAAYSAARLAGGRLHLLGGRFHSWMFSEPELAVDIIAGAVLWTWQVDVG